MCISPVWINQTEVACRNCWQCRKARIQDWAGRCIAESLKSDESVMLTLTYSDKEEEKAKLLHYKDIQLLMKRLRWDGYRVRYLVAGEYGAAKGRAHWHIILFFKGRAPAFEFEKLTNWPYWPEGFSWASRLTYAGAAYTCKYAMKDQSLAHKQRHLMPVLSFGMSKKPTLGAEYFRDLAETHAKAGLAPRGFIYTFPDVLGDGGHRTRFYMRGVVQREFMDAFLAAWPRFNPGRPIPHTDHLDRYTDTLVEQDPDLQWDALIASLAGKDQGWEAQGLPIVQVRPAPGGYITKDTSGTFRYCKLDNEGKKIWHAKLQSVGDARKALRGQLSRASWDRLHQFKSILTPSRDASPMN